MSVSLKRKYHVSYDGGKTLEEKEEEVYSANITHNLGEMAKEAGIYEALWKPNMLKEEANPVRAYEIIAIVENGLEDMKARPEHYEKFNYPNWWETYKYFVPFVENYLAACKEFPEAMVEVWR